MAKKEIREEIREEIRKNFEKRNKAHDILLNCDLEMSELARLLLDCSKLK